MCRKNMSGKSNTKISNPYAKSAPKSNTSKNATISNTAKSKIQESRSKSKRDMSTSVSGNVDANVSFSQAFESMEKSQHFRTTMSEVREQSAREAAAKQATMTSEELMSAYPHVLLVSTKQRGNGILRYVRNVPIQYVQIVPDYLCGPNRCALFLSFKYHNLHPQYIYRRIKELKSDYDLRLLLCLVDVEDNESILSVLNKTCCVNNMTLILAWSEEEVARYLETFKAFEGKDASTIQKKKEVTFPEQVADVLGCIRSVNKTDAATLKNQFKNVRSVMNASVDDIRQCPGIGEKKARRLYDAFNKPFSSVMAKKRKEERGLSAVVNEEEGIRPKDEEPQQNEEG